MRRVLVEPDLRVGGAVPDPRIGPGARAAHRNDDELVRVGSELDPHGRVAPGTVLIEREICAGSHFFGSLSAPGRPPESLKEIEAILDALVNRDGPRAEELCRQHIDAAAAAILAAPGAQFRDS